MKALIVSLILLICLTSFAIAEGDGFLKMIENTDQCFDCHTIYQLCNPTDNPILLSSKDSFNLKFYTTKGEVFSPLDEKQIVRGSVITDGDDSFSPTLMIETTHNLSSVITDYAPCSKQINEYDNLTGESLEKSVDSICVVGAHTETKIVKAWQDSTAMEGRQIDPNECVSIKVAGFLMPGQAVDNVISYNGKEYFEYAWWNNSWTGKVNITLENRYNDSLTNYPVNITLDTSNTALWGNCSSIRIIYSDTNSVNWINTTSCGSSNTQIWFRATLNSVSNNSLYALYYGNPYAPEARTNTTDVLGHPRDGNSVLIYNMDEMSGSTSKSTGTQSLDLTHKGISGTIAGGIWAANSSACKYNGCTQYSGVGADNNGQWLEGSSVSFIPSSSSYWTMECWIKSNSTIMGEIMARGKAFEDR